jgi:hypothetical protein
MKYVLLAALLATLSPAQAGDTNLEIDCATRPYVGACEDAGPSETAATLVLVEPKNPAPETDCSAYPYVGVCDTAAED